MSSAVHAVDVRRSSGTVLKLALRRHVAVEVLEDKPDAAECEARNLRLVESAGIAAPRLIAVDATGAECDVPAVLMTRLAGHLDLKPRDIDSWLRTMAELLPPIHAVNTRGARVAKWELWDDLRQAQPPEWTRNRKDWERVIEISRRPWPRYVPRFIHRDFQHYNVLWWRGRPTGVVDWVDASLGPAEIDFGHFRHNLVFDFGYEVAERFAALYREVTGEEPDPFWEALTLPAKWARSPEQHAATDRYVSSLASNG
jgi:aminoglycoside phosphotransferase (APT) family kinase protein